MPKVCTIPNCGRKAYARGYCLPHYKHAHYLGLRPLPRRTPEERYESRIDRTTSPNGCHPWMAGTGRFGYGRLKLNGKTVPAHKFGYELLHGPVPRGMQVRHTCDNPPCQNPAHLIVGSPADNMRDRNDRGREAHNFGETNGQARLSAQQVSDIRDSYARDGVFQRDLAARYGISQSAVSMIVRRIHWPHV